MRQQRQRSLRREQITVENSADNAPEQLSQGDEEQSIKSQVEKQIGEKVKEAIIEKIENI